MKTIDEYLEEQINERYAGWVALSLDWLGEVM